jgi:hypothetical protein
MSRVLSDVTSTGRRHAVAVRSEFDPICAVQTAYPNVDFGAEDPET